MAKKIKHAKISFLSLVPKGANKLPGLYKSEDDSLEWASLLKEPTDFEEKGQLTSLVYIPNHEDSQGHSASGNTIEKMAHSFMEEGAKVDIRHDRRELKPAQAYVAESFIVQSGDPRFDGIKDHLGKEIDATGGWGVIMQINDPELRKAYKKGEWDGISLFSYAGDYEIEDHSDPVSKALEEFQRKLTKPENLIMEKKEMLELLKENNESLIETIVGALKPVEEEVEEIKKEEGAPVFKGSHSNMEELKAFEKELTLYNLQKEYDFSDPAQIAKYREAVESLEKTVETEKPESDDEESELLKQQISELEKELNSRKRKAKVLPESTQVEAMNGLTKEEQDAFEIGNQIAETANNWRGYN